MSTLSQLFGNTGTPVQILSAANLASLANAAAFASAPVDLSSISPVPTNLLIGQENGFKTAAGSLGSNPAIRIWFSPSLDGTLFGGSYGTHTLGGAAASFTMPSNTGNLILLTQLPINGAAAAEAMSPYDVLIDLSFLPKQGVFIVENQTGLALDSVAPGDLYYLAGNIQF